MKGLFVTSSSAALTGTIYKKVGNLPLKAQEHIIGSTGKENLLRTSFFPHFNFHWSQISAWVSWWGKVGLLHQDVVHLSALSSAYPMHNPILHCIWIGLITFLTPC